MRKPILAVLMMFTGTFTLSGLLFAQPQQPPTSGSQQTPATSSQKPAAPKSTTSTAAKPAAKPSTAPKPLVLTTDKDKQSYAVGMQIAKGMKEQGVDVDPAIMGRAIKDVLTGAKPLMTDDEALDTLKKLQVQVREEQETKRKELADKNAKEGPEFLAANKTKPGVVTLPDGLQYKILTEGTGPKPVASDTVICQYRGTLIDGTEFDSSYKRGQPATFPVGRVIKGWTEALQMMPVGSKWQLFIPADLAYGERGYGNLIGPNAVLIFEIDLMSIKPPMPPPGQVQPGTPAPNGGPNPNVAPSPNTGATPTPGTAPGTGSSSTPGATPPPRTGPNLDK